MEAMLKIQLLSTDIESERGVEVRRLLRMSLVTVIHFQNRGWALLLLLLIAFVNKLGITSIIQGGTSCPQ